MKKHLKKGISLFLAVLLVFGGTALGDGIAALAVESELIFIGNQLSWDLDEGLLTLSGEGAMELVYLYDPESPVGSIARYDIRRDFEEINSADVHTIIVEEGVTGLLDSAFAHFEHVTSVYLPRSLKTFGKDSFYYTGNLVIYCYPNSEAHMYAMANGFRFVLLDDDMVLFRYNTDYDNGIALVKWSEALFRNESFVYNKDLAQVAAALTAAASDGNEAYRGTGRYIVPAYEALDFDDISLFSYPDNEKYNEDSFDWAKDDDFAFSIAHKKMGNMNVVAIILRGTETFAEVRDDFFTTANEDFYGYKVYGAFLRYMEDVWLGLKYYANAHPEIKSSDTSFLIAGHSLGGAAANLLAAKMTLSQKENYNEWAGWSVIPQREDIYAFTFGALNSLNGNESRNYKSGFEYIHNIFNYYDTFGPNGEGVNGLGIKVADGKNSWNYKFGEVTLFQINYKGLFRKGASYKNHVMQCYFNAISAGFDRFKAAEALGNLYESPLNTKQYVIKNIVPVRNQPYDVGSVTRFLSKGETVNIQAVVLNTYGNYWYKVNDGWVYHENLTPLKNGFGSFDAAIKVFSVKCPVDVAVYDSQGNLVASIVNNIASVPSDTVYPYVLGDVKQIFVFDDETYTIKLTATGEGFMNLTVQQYDSLTDEFVLEKNYKEVALIGGKQMQSEIHTDTEISDVQLTVLDDQGNPVATVREDGTERLIGDATIESITYSGFTTLVYGCAANIPVTVDAYNPDRLDIYAGLFIDGTIAASAPVIDGKALIKMSAVNGAEAYVAAWFDGEDPDMVAAKEIPVRRLPTNIWMPEIGMSGDGVTSVIFAERISLTAPAAIRVGGNSVESFWIDGNVLYMEQYVTAGQILELKGIKYPELFPSYSFTFTITA